MLSQLDIYVYIVKMKCIEHMRDNPIDYTQLRQLLYSNNYDVQYVECA